MCGIAVAFSEQRCRQMINKMQHRGLRGLDYQRVVQVEEGLYFGHTRLPIIDTTVKQNQPMANDQIIMMFNGEIYNYKEISRSATSDTEVLLDLLTYAGPKGLEEVDGMYSIVYFDYRDGSLNLITDHLAKKPLYINRETGEIASEIKAVVRNRKLNKQFLSNVAHFGYNPNEKTVFTDVVGMAPNSHLRMDVIGPVWNDCVVDMSPRMNDLRSVITKAVQNRLVSDIPISFLLSGGLDSSIICKLAWMNREDPMAMDLFTVKNGIDHEFAWMMADDMGLCITDLDLSSTPILDKIMYANESPSDMGSVVPQYELCKAVAKEGYRVVITGDGADELFGGYTRMSKYISSSADTQYHDIFSELPYYHCPRLDKLSMCHTVELRSPFLSRSVIRAGLATSYPDRINKSILRKVFSDLLPKEIINRDKEPLRINDMREDRMKFRFDRMELFNDLVEGGVYD